MNSPARIVWGVHIHCPSVGLDVGGRSVNMITLNGPINSSITDCVCCSWPGDYHVLSTLYLSHNQRCLATVGFSIASSGSVRHTKDYTLPHSSCVRPIFSESYWVNCHHSFLVVNIVHYETLRSSEASSMV